jgi:hypothetical protein
MADDEAVSTNHLIELICQSLGEKVHIWHVSKGLIECAAKVGNLLHLPLNTDRLNKLTENYVASNAKIKQALGINRMPVSAEQGLLKTLNSFKS